MNRISQLFVAGIVAFPLIAAAQTTTPSSAPSPSPGVNGPPATTTKSQASAPTAPGLPNATPSTDSPSTGSTAKPKTKRHAMKKSEVPKSGDVPTYPAPAPDGTPTK